MLYWILRVIIIIILKLFFRFEVRGAENVPQKTNFIVAANHASFMDPVVVGAAIPKKIYWLALREIYSIFWVRLFMKMTTEPLLVGGSSQKAEYLLTRNVDLGLFPEGGLTRDGNLGEFRRGVALLAIKTGRPVVPCAILGTYEALPITAKFPRLSPITVKIGEPIYLLKEFEDIIDDVQLQEGIFKIRNAIKELLNAK